MADLTVTAANVGLVDPLHAEVYSFVAAETITAGQVVFLDTNGKVQLADANAAGEQQARGIALNGGGAGAAIDVLKEGLVYGFDLSGVAYDGIVYLSDTTAGYLADGTGTMTVVCGRVIPAADKDLTKLLYANFRWREAWS